jgi:hypothetical protein
MPSEVVGTAGLWLALLAAVVIATIRRPPPSRLVAAVRPAVIALALQSLHFAEEFVTGFYRLFPARLGIAPWSAGFFVVFNASWLAAWLVAVWAASAGRAFSFASIALWFLAVAAMANAVAHPTLALLARGYFSGLWTSPLLGISGFFLARSLARG